MTELAEERAPALQRLDVEHGQVHADLEPEQEHQEL